jgi:hypothetical protein
MQPEDIFNWCQKALKGQDGTTAHWMVVVEKCQDGLCRVLDRNLRECLLSVGSPLLWVGFVSRGVDSSGLLHSSDAFVHGCHAEVGNCEGKSMIGFDSMSATFCTQ